MRIPMCVIADDLVKDGLTADGLLDKVVDFRQIELTDNEIARVAWKAACAYQDWYAKLLLASAEHAPIEEFVALATERLENPLAVFAADGSVLARGGEFVGPIEGTIWERLESGSLDWGFYARQDQERLTRDAMRATAPARFSPSVDPTHEYLSAFVRVRGMVVASLGMVDINMPITTGQAQVMAAICELLGIYLENNDLYLQLSKGSTSVMRELLQGEAVPQDAVSYWLAEHGFAPSGPLLLAVMTNPHADVGEKVQTPYASELRRLLPDACIVSLESTIAVLSPSGEDDAAHIERLGAAAEQIGVSCGLSPVVRDPMNLRTHYVQAHAAAREASERGVPILGFESCVEPGLRSLMRSGDTPWMWCDSGVRMLWVRDEGGRELVRCLWEYLLHGRNIAASARALYVHRNTLIYRLGRIERELGLSLDDLNRDQLLFLLTSCISVMEE